MTEQCCSSSRSPDFSFLYSEPCGCGRDAKRLRKNGVSITPGLWAVLVFLFWLLSLPAYLLLRRFSWQRQLTPPREVAQEFE